MNEEMIKKAKAAKSVEELLALAKENDIELGEAQAKEYFEHLHATGELADDELDNVAGGGCGGEDPTEYCFWGQCTNTSCKAYNQTMAVPDKGTKCPVCGNTMTTWRRRC